MSFYLSLMKRGKPLLERYSGKLGEVSAGRSNFTFRDYEDWNVQRLASLIAEAERIFRSDPRRCRLAHGGTKPLRER